MCNGCQTLHMSEVPLYLCSSFYHALLHCPDWAAELCILAHLVDVVGQSNDKFSPFLLMPYKNALLPALTACWVGGVGQPYRHASKQILAVLERFGSAERLGMDEVLVDVTTEVDRRTQQGLSSTAFHGHVHRPQVRHEIMQLLFIPAG